MYTHHWKQYYKPDKRTTYRYEDGYRSTTAGRPWCMHTFSTNCWSPVGGRLVISSRPVHYGLKHLPQVKMPKKPSDCWWEFDPREKKWYPVKCGIYGCWAIDEGSDCIVALYPQNPKGAFGNRGGKGVTWVCDLEKNEWTSSVPEPSAPYYGMSFKMAYAPRHKTTLFVVGNVCWSFKAPKKDAKAKK